MLKTYMSDVKPIFDRKTAYKLVNKFELVSKKTNISKSVTKKDGDYH